jgi:hypothetical protein
MMRRHCKPATLLVLAVSTTLCTFFYIRWYGAGRPANADNFGGVHENTWCVPEGSHPCPDCLDTEWLFTQGQRALWVILGK